MRKRHVRFAKLLDDLCGIPKFRETGFKKLSSKSTDKLEGKRSVKNLKL